MMSKHNVAVIVGSLRKDSINLKLAKALEKLAEGRLRFDYVRIGNLPLYNQDFDEDYPAEAVRFKESIKAADAVLFVTPEYNRSVPGVLKNALDLASRPYGQNVFNGKPGAITGASGGGIGTALAQQHLRSVLTFLNVIAMPQPEVYLQFKEGLVDDRHDLTNEGTRKFLQGFIDQFVAWIEKQRV